MLMALMLGLAMAAPATTCERGDVVKALRIAADEETGDAALDEPPLTFLADPCQAMTAVLVDCGHVGPCVESPEAKVLRLERELACAKEEADRVKEAEKRKGRRREFVRAVLWACDVRPSPNRVLTPGHR